MVRKRLIILIGITIVCTGGILAKKTLVEENSISTRTQWEYGVYRVGFSHQRYEWHDADKRIYGDSKSIFLGRMGLGFIITKLEAMGQGLKYEYVLDVELINHLGAQGWELVDVMDRGSGVIINRTFWFKRQK